MKIAKTETSCVQRSRLLHALAGCGRRCATCPGEQGACRGRQRCPSRSQTHRGVDFFGEMMIPTYSRPRGLWASMRCPDSRRDRAFFYSTQSCASLRSEQQYLFGIATILTVLRAGDVAVVVPQVFLSCSARSRTELCVGELTRRVIRSRRRVRQICDNIVHRKCFANSHFGTTVFV